jgi:hypothetical protein
MAALAYSGSWQRLRKALLASGEWVGTPCPRCLEPLWPSQRLHLGHAVDVAAGGFGGPVRIEHASCNEAAGARAGSARRKARLARERSAAEKAAHDHRVAVLERREAGRAFEALDGPGLVSAAVHPLGSQREYGVIHQVRLCLSKA